MGLGESGRYVTQKEAVSYVCYVPNKYVFISSYQHSGQNYNIKVPNKLFENAVSFKYLEMSVT
jgi:hypothetical protein